MTRTADIDQLLASWLADGLDQAPEDRLRGALAEVAHTRQRRTLAGLFGSGIHGSTMLAAVVAGLLAVIIGLGVGIQTGLIRIPNPDVEPPAPPNSSAPPTASAAPRPSPSDSAALGPWVLYSNPRLGHEIAAPASWSPTIDPRVGESVVRYGALTISLGDTDGTFHLCRTGSPATCASRRASSRDEIDAAIRELAPDVGATQTTALLSGWPASIAYGRGPDSAFPYMVYSVINGRPVVLTFDLPTLREQRVSPSQAMAMVGDFRLLGVPGNPPVDRLRTFVSPDGSFEIRLPETWSATVGSDPSALYLRDRQHELSIRAGDDGGSIRTCDESAGSWETCATIRPATLGEFSNGIGLRATSGVFQGPLRSSTTLAGESAIRVHIVGGPSAHTVTYWVAFHEGRPFVLRFAVARGIDPTAEVFSDILSGFSFLDD